MLQAKYKVNVANKLKGTIEIWGRDTKWEDNLKMSAFTRHIEK